MITFLAFLTIFSLLVLVHELGHFVAAKKLGVRVDEFGIGLPPRLWSKKKGETRFVINLIPLGGYVKLFGEDGTKDTNPRNLQNLKSGQKVLIFGAGVLMNLILAYVMMTGFYLFGGRPLIDGMNRYPGIIDSQAVAIQEVEPDSPAAKQGLQAEDVILSINDKNIRQSVEGSREINAAGLGDKKVVIKVRRGEEVLTKNVEIYTDKVMHQGKEYEVQRIGMVMKETGKIRAKWYLAPVIALQETVRLTWLSVKGVGEFLATLASNFKISENVGGVVAIYTLTGVATGLGIGALVQLAALLSMALAAFNILPFPALDGGHILFVLIEKITGKEIKPNVKGIMNLVGFGLLLILVIAITWTDFNRFGILEKIKGVF